MSGSKSNGDEAKVNVVSEFFGGVKREFAKVRFPKKTDAKRQTIAVIIITVILGLIITAFDALIQIGIEFLSQIH